MPAPRPEDPEACAKIAQACRSLLELAESEPEIFRRTLPLLTPENIATLRELAEWDQP